ncbi:MULTISPECIES: holo-ACP synthase [Enterococcus]|uniref:Holo-[acyl-carrier-protein] synthase n=1 Tax=Enterococcus alishanensis TaxID=1303817 RepID=A0ABS6TEJ0_9ENTE|nr:holo-ACP synthase [Enterococcus alishanensis]MBV7391319.1 holo-ACP synthase [Enterococcus alishanensis]
MIKGIGIDAVELARIEKIIERRPHFISRILTPGEIELFDAHIKQRQVEFLAGRYACKEAFSKAWGTGIGEISFQDLEILRNQKGSPIFTKSPHPLDQVFVTLTHTEEIAIAQVLLER